jgi:hypothetical protein
MVMLLQPGKGFIMGILQKVGVSKKHSLDTGAEQTHQYILQKVLNINSEHQSLMCHYTHQAIK